MYLLSCIIIYCDFFVLYMDSGPHKVIISPRKGQSSVNLKTVPEEYHRMFENAFAGSQSFILGIDTTHLNAQEILNKDTEVPSFQYKVENDILWHERCFSTFAYSTNLQWIKSRLSSKSVCSANSFF